MPCRSMHPLSDRSSFHTCVISERKDQFRQGSTPVAFYRVNRIKANELGTGSSLDYNRNHSSIFLLLTEIRATVARWIWGDMSVAYAQPCTSPLVPLELVFVREKKPRPRGILEENLFSFMKSIFHSFLPALNVDLKNMPHINSTQGDSYFSGMSKLQLNYTRRSFLSRECPIRQSLFALTQM